MYTGEWWSEDNVIRLNLHYFKWSSVERVLFLSFIAQSNWCSFIHTLFSVCNLVLVAFFSFDAAFVGFSEYCWFRLNLVRRLGVVVCERSRVSFEETEFCSDETCQEFTSNTWSTKTESNHNIANGAFCTIQSKRHWTPVRWNCWLKEFQSRKSKENRNNQQEISAWNFISFRLHLPFGIWHWSTGCFGHQIQVLECKQCQRIFPHRFWVLFHSSSTETGEKWPFYQLRVKIISVRRLSATVQIARK